MGDGQKASTLEEDREGKQGGLGQHQASQLLRYDRPHLHRLEYISRFYVPFLLFVTRQGSDVRFLKVLLFLPSHQDKNECPRPCWSVSFADRSYLSIGANWCLHVSPRAPFPPSFAVLARDAMVWLRHSIPCSTHMSLALRHGRLFQATVSSGLGCYICAQCS